MLNPFKIEVSIDVTKWIQRLTMFAGSATVLGASFYLGYRHGSCELQDSSPIGIHDVGQNDEIEAILSQFDLTDDQLLDIMNYLEEEMNKGLDPERKDMSDLKMIPSFVRHLPNGTEKGKIVALDLGGTNFRVLEVNLEEGQIETNSKMFVIPERLMIAPGVELFDYLATSISNFMKSQRLYRRNRHFPCGFTFSFPCQQEALNCARLLQWTKGYHCVGIEGEDIAEVLQKSMSRYKDFNLEVLAVINDTVGTLINCAYKYKNCLIGVIFGTGTNACYVEDLERVKTWTGDREDPKQVVINTEWGAFGDGGCLDHIRTSFDDKIDKTSVNPGKQKFEKLISGMYMGELTRVITMDLMSRRLLFRGLIDGRRKDSSKQENPMQTPGSFYTKFVSDVETDEGVAFSRTKQLMEEFGVNTPTYDDCAILKQICERISKRGALLSAAAIAVLVNRIGRPKITISVDGSLYRCHPKFKRNLDAALSRLTARWISYKIVLSDDGSGRGAAICAAVAERVRQDEIRKERAASGVPEINRSLSSPSMSCPTSQHNSD